jgi:hypothetical protein
VEGGAVGGWAVGLGAWGLGALAREAWGCNRFRSTDGVQGNASVVSVARYAKVLQGMVCDCLLPGRLRAGRARRRRVGRRRARWVGWRPSIGGSEVVAI